MATLQEPQFNLEALSGDDSRRQSISSDGSEESVTTAMEIGRLLPEEEEVVVVVEKGRTSSVSDFSVVDLDGGGGGGGGGDGGGGGGGVVDLLKVERDCRICHLSLNLDVNVEECESGIVIELGCCCKDDLGVAHKHCAETWFKIKGNRTCEICGSIARNIGGADGAEPIDQWNEPNGSTPPRAAVPGETMATCSFWQGHRFLNFLLAAMVFAFVISWLFHFNIPS